jgi:adenine-specific DNA-methyltransferase
MPTSLFPRRSQGKNSSDVVSGVFSELNKVTLACMDCKEFLRTLPSGCAQLVVTSPPYNIGKEYETRVALDEYVEQQSVVIQECARILGDQGSLCWQVGNYVHRGAIVPLDIALYPAFAGAGLTMRNRIVWHFEHGLHCSRRLSGRYETICWLTKSDSYTFNVDPIRVPQKYPGKKYFKGPRAGEYSCNPSGKNPGDVWVFPNVKHNHVEKTIHPCQFPVELVERLVLSMSRSDELVVDPFMGVGTSAIAAIRHGRRAAGSEIRADYVEIARQRVLLESNGQLRTRPMGREVYSPKGESVARLPFAE